MNSLHFYKTWTWYIIWKKALYSVIMSNLFHILGIFPMVFFRSVLSGTQKSYGLRENLNSSHVNSLRVGALSVMKFSLHLLNLNMRYRLFKRKEMWKSFNLSWRTFSTTLWKRIKGTNSQFNGSLVFHPPYACLTDCAFPFHFPCLDPIPIHQGAPSGPSGNIRGGLMVI